MKRSGARREVRRCFSVLVGLSLAASVLCGCGDTGSSQPEADDELVTLYHEDKGLILPEAVKQSLGVELVEVTETNSSVPLASVIEGAQESFVYVENGDHLVRTPVKIGAATDGRVEVTEGLLAGDRVVAVAAKDLWMIELLAVRGGNPCCVVPKKRSKA